MLTVRDWSSRLREVALHRIYSVFTPPDVDSHIPQEFHPSLAVSPPHNPSTLLDASLISTRFSDESSPGSKKTRKAKSSIV